MMFSAPVSMRPVAAAITLLLLSGCATFSSDGGFGSVQSMTRERIGRDITWVKTDADAASVDKTIAPLLQRALSVDDAVTIALLNNKGLQADYAELGISEAQLVQAGRISNPSFSFGRLTRGGEVEIDRRLMLPVMSLLMMPVSKRIAKRGFEQAQLRAAGDALRVADDTRRAYFSAIAAQESVLYMGQVKLAAEASAELAVKMVAAGNWSKLDLAREQAFYADVTVRLAQAMQMHVSQREALTRLMGLSGERTRFLLPNRLPDLPVAPREPGDLEAAALQNRLDVQMARRELAGVAESLGLTKSTRFINVLDVSYLRNTFSESPSRERGFEIELQIPLFDWGGARVARAEAIYMQAANRTTQIAVNARSQVREAYTAYRSAYDIAKHYRDEVVPIQKRISEEQLLRYNGMLISVFELLADARSQVTSVNASIEAQRDFWMAESALQMVQTGRATDGASMGRSNSPATEAASH
ncbi:TolC family protein [Massilia sp. P8910]|uniref:TolC family protein n=1 Tax=Massilia antarctica TaxID=2765360 RepID=UPI001E2B4FED|nr:TolC family protein [Massilia antarctica]MCE3602823.1 TolC family protein [Massilia antarctica]